MHPADPPVVGPEVVAPVADAVGLVDHEQPGRWVTSAARCAGTDALAEALRRDEQHVELVALQCRCFDLVPLVAVVARRARSGSGMRRSSATCCRW